MEDDEGEESATTAKKKRCSYNKDSDTIYPWVKSVKGESDQVFCDVGQSRFSVAHRGEYNTDNARLKRASCSKGGFNSSVLWTPFY